MLPVLEINPIAFEVFGIPIHWYAICIVTGALVAVFLANREAIRKGFGNDDIVDFVLFALPLGIIGARIYYVLFELPYYMEHPDEIIAIWNGGLAIYGGLIMGAIVLLIFSKKRNLNPWLFLDIAMPSVMVGQMFGRWGNFANHEAFGGTVSKQFLSDTLHLPNFIVSNMYIDGAYHHPTFLYESMWNLLGFIIIILLRRKLHFYKIGEIFASYLIWYGTGRFFIEGMRTDSLYLFANVRVSQLLSLILVVAGIILIIYRRKTMASDYYTTHKGEPLL
jgi:phosphatidylglycerol:prolipoprotein diacylglycerol transferase